MSFASLLEHTLTIVRTPRDSSSLDGYGQPTASAPVSTTVQGSVQPKGSRELADSRSAGSPIGDFTIFLEPMEVDPADAVLYGGYRYELTSVRPYLFGSVPHLECDARRVGPVATQ